MIATKRPQAHFATLDLPAVCDTTSEARWWGLDMRCACIIAAAALVRATHATAAPVYLDCATRYDQPYNVGFDLDEASQTATESFLDTKVPSQTHPAQFNADTVVINDSIVINGTVISMSVRTIDRVTLSLTTGTTDSGEIKVLHGQCRLSKGPKRKF